MNELETGKVIITTEQYIKLTKCRELVENILKRAYALKGKDGKAFFVGYTVDDGYVKMLFPEEHKQACERAREVAEKNDV